MTLALQVRKNNQMTGDTAQVSVITSPWLVRLILKQLDPGVSL